VFLRFLDFFGWFFGLFCSSPGSSEVMGRMQGPRGGAGKGLCAAVEHALSLKAAGADLMHFLCLRMATAWGGEGGVSVPFQEEWFFLDCSWIAPFGQHSPLIVNQLSHQLLKHRDQTKMAAQHNQHTLSSYTNTKVMKQALYGQILSATAKSSGERVVLKQLLRECVERKLVVSDLKPFGNKRALPMLEDAKLELDVLKRLNNNGGHPNVVRLHEGFETSTHFVMVMDLLQGDLFDRVMDSGKLAESTAQKYFLDAVGGLDFVHSRGIAHRDLSLENLLLDSEDRCVITDFGLCCECADGQKQTQKVGKGFYIAPEIYADSGAYDAKRADVWSLGVILFIMMTGAPPMERPSKGDKRFCCIRDGRIANMLEQWGMINNFRRSDECLDLLSSIC
jgi:serine/threonine protein kinase